jgi:hypothetical protein
MNHKEYIEIYFKYLDGECSADDFKEAEKHIQNCLICKKEINDILKLSKGLKDNFSNISLPSDLLNYIKKGVDMNTPNQTKLYKKLIFAFSITLVLILFGINYFKNNKKEEQITIAKSSIQNKENRIVKNEIKENSVKSISNEESLKILDNKIKRLSSDMFKLGKILITTPQPNLFIIKGGDVSSQIEIATKLAKEIFLEIIPNKEVNEILERMHLRLPVISQMKKEGKIGEGYDGMLKIMEDVNISDEEKRIIKLENEDREKLIELFTENLSKGIPFSKGIVKKKVVEQFAGMMRAISDKGVYYEKPPGKWQKKEREVNL